MSGWGEAGVRLRRGGGRGTWVEECGCGGVGGSGCRRSRKRGSDVGVCAIDQDRGVSGGVTFL